MTPVYPIFYTVVTVALKVNKLATSHLGELTLTQVQNKHFNSILSLTFICEYEGWLFAKNTTILCGELYLLKLKVINIKLK